MNDFGQCFDNYYVCVHSLISEFKNVKCILLLGETQDSVILAVTNMYGIKKCRISNAKYNLYTSEYKVIENNTELYNNNLGCNCCVISIHSKLYAKTLTKIASLYKQSIILSSIDIGIKNFNKFVVMYDNVHMIVYSNFINSVAYIASIKGYLFNPLNRLNCIMPKDIQMHNETIEYLDDIFDHSYKDTKNAHVRINIELPMSNKIIFYSIMHAIIDHDNITIKSYNRSFESIHNGNWTVYKHNGIISYELCIGSNKIIYPNVKAMLIDDSVNNYKYPNLIPYDMMSEIVVRLKGSNILFNIGYAKSVYNNVSLCCDSNDKTSKPSQIYNELIRFINLSTSMDYYLLYARYKYITSVCNDFMYTIKDAKPFPRSITYDDIKNIILCDYVYTNKSTGIRVNVYVTQEGTFSIDSNNIIKLISIYSNDKISIFDAEDIDGVIYVFDVLVYNNNIMINKPFYKRIGYFKLINIPHVFTKVFNKVVCIDDIRYMCMHNEGCILYDINSTYDIPPIKIKSLDTIDVIISKSNNTIYGIDNNMLCNVSMSIISKYAKDFILSHNMIEGLIYEVHCISDNRLSCCSNVDIYNIVDKEVKSSIGTICSRYCSINDVHHPIVDLRKDKLRPNKMKTIEEISKNIGMYALNGCGLDYARAISSTVKTLGLILVRISGCKSILDIGSGKGGDIDKLNIFDNITMIEPYDDFRILCERLKRYPPKYKALNIRLRDIGYYDNNYDAIHASFCMNLFEKEDIDSLKFLISNSANLKCIFIIYVDELPDNYNGKHIIINRTSNSSYNVMRSRYHDKHHNITKLNTSEVVVHIHKYIISHKFIPVINCKPFVKCPMTNDERALLSKYRLSIYANRDMDINIDKEMFIGDNYDVTLGEFMKCFMYYNNDNAYISLSDREFKVNISNLRKDVFKAFKYFS